MAWQIIGHEWAAELLRCSIEKGRITHANLITGPPRVGKTRLALAFAQALNCEQPDSPCGQCSSCRRIAAGSHPDVKVIVGSGADDSIKIDQVRALQREAVLAPYEGQHRLFILRRADQATTEAANSLLKLLEEPPTHVVLVLTAVQPEALPATILSRCQRLDLRPVPTAVIEEALIGRGQNPADARLLARLSGGRVGWAVQASRDDGVLQQREQEFDQIPELLVSGRVERLDYAWKAGRDKRVLLQRLESWALWWRDLLLLSVGNDDHVYNADRTDDLRNALAQTTLPEIWAALQALHRASEQLHDNVNARLVLEALLLKMPSWQSQGLGTKN